MEQKFKEGDLVEVEGSEKILFRLIFIDNDIAWVVSMCEKKFHLLPKISDLRKPLDKDREKAKELIYKYVQATVNSKTVQHSFINDKAIQMLLEAIKYGENKNK